MEAAKAAKAEANNAFKEKDYETAAALYTRALKLLGADRKGGDDTEGTDGAVSGEKGEEERTLQRDLLLNRSLMNIRMELYGAALEDAEEALRVDPQSAKAYYRRGSAHVALNRMKDARADFRASVRIAPKDRQARARVAEVDKIIRTRAFEAAIASDNTKAVAVAVREGWCAMTSPADEWITFPLSPPEHDSHFDAKQQQQPSAPIDRAWIETLRDGFKSDKRLSLKTAYSILLYMHRLLEYSPTLVDVVVPPDADGVEGHVTVFGDLHGQYYDMMHALEMCGLPSDTHTIIFNGDLVDRGSWSVEVIFLAMCLKIWRPDRVHIARGNHEAESMTKVYGFQGEVKHKLSEKCYELFSEVFRRLPLVHLVENKVFITHGGLFSEDGVTIEQIRDIKREREPPEDGPMCELLWSDPLPEGSGRQPSKRGVGCMFGSDVTQRFCSSNNIDCVIRSHEVRMEGYSVEHDGRLVTVFSAPNYCDQQGNKAAFVTLKRSNGLKPTFTQYSHVPHPPLKAMAYSGMGGFGL